MPDAVPRIRQNRVRRAFDRVAPAFATSDFLYREMSRRMDERLDVVRIAPERILDAGCGLGIDRQAVQQRYPDADWFGLDHSVEMLRHGRATEEAALSFMRRLLNPGRRRQSFLMAASIDALPFAAQKMDLIWSNAALHWLNDLSDVFREFNRVLRVGGLLMFSTFGPDTLKELRQSIDAISGKGSNRIHEFTDMHDIGDMLLQTGFSDPVMDMETLKLTYADPWQAMRELRLAGSVSAQYEIHRGLGAKSFWPRVFEHWPRDMQGRYVLTFELVQGHAWKASPRQHEDGRAVINFMSRPGQPRRPD